ALDRTKSCTAMTDTGPMTPILSSHEMRAVLRSIYRDSGRLTRELVAWRDSICPYESITRWVPPAAHVLDFGCGAGALLALMSERHQIASGTGCDVSGHGISAAKAAQRRLSRDVLEFRHIRDFEDIPDDKFDVVAMIDVLHHISPARQQEAIHAAARRVAPGGRFIYKDMTRHPFWRRWANTTHDLLLARQLVHYVAPDRVVRWALDDGMTLLHAEDYSRFVYGHQLLVFSR
ncbi:MAG: class I SAM-dependent methyltransferase, partial [Pseudomonadota bacterium]|nr:class I SAM-dependent methyltransferase [Pseudomonadota bacterium]